VAKDKGIIFEQDSWNNDKLGAMQDFYIAAKDQDVTLDEKAATEANCASEKNKQADGSYRCRLTGAKVMSLYLASLPAELQPPDDLQILFEKQIVRGRAVSDADTNWRSYLLTRSAPLTGTAVAQADVVFNPTTNFPEVSITFNRKGGKDFGDLTTANVGKRMAIILDEEVKSAPQIIGPIPDGRCSITMGGQDAAAVLKEAQDLVTVLRTGALPAPLRQESESQIGATLGQDAIDRAQISMLVGALLVIVMMLYFYRTSGMIANIAMLLNVLFQMAVLAMFQATLTLPGIAGIVLTIGMAVDSNIIIYERIREELRSGKTVKGAVDAGFGHAFWTVFDAHVTNFVAGFVLLEYGSGPIRGFAVMLLIGVVVNLFTSTWVSRYFFDFWLSRRRNSSAPLSI
jgi:preprotein translocase subunit SecD